ncbi:MAG: hypothetical protein HY656_08375 [Acidobacteria bacterium]|nr:hypothetical protein [Acidobacteriota bacterium]
MKKTPATTRAPAAALGLRAHSGWAALVALAGSSRKPAVVERRRIQTADPAIPGSKQPYHAAEGWELDKAAKYLRRCTARSRLLARQALRSVINDLKKRGYGVVGCGLLLGSGQTPASLASILTSHPLIHTAEGQLFREVLVHAAKHCRMPVTGVKERELFPQAAARLRLPVRKLQSWVAGMGRDLGPPWTQDQKLAALVGWLALAKKTE